MTATIIETVRRTVTDLLAERGMPIQIDDGESLFDSGKLDSMAAVNIMMKLEADFGIDLSDPDFDISQIDSVEGISELVSRQMN
ncbi:MAG: hypothetical protein CML29_01630 [Rhizobiales bacterium]|nr:hypothetical protein [Hyphomicrobiales bacterium]MBA68053.1 hypothetical protein [Hyphomicrobiales bacterium]|tara:strand:+ start:520 stop:771 length:252 start_codon:yes stop_codon:yes gene_type:complete